MCLGLFSILLLVLFSSSSFVSAIGCYECDSSANFTCSEFWEADAAAPYLSINCDHVFKPTHCIKMTGVFDGKLGTKRFCSSKTWGNYCEYNKRPGDVQEYRSCVFSCSTHGCNGASKVDGVLASMIVIILISSSTNTLAV